MKILELNEYFVILWLDCADGAVFFNIMLGAHNVRLASEPTRVEINNVTTYTLHPEWKPNIIRNDVAIIKLPKPITFTCKILNFILESDSTKQIWNFWFVYL